jgi:hypothetical protein
MRKESHNNVNEGQPSQRVSINDRLGVEDKDLKQLFSDVELVELKLPDSVFVGQVDKVTFQQNKIFIFDKRCSLLLVFDVNGGYVGKVGEVGVGPGQYQSIEDFSVWGDTITVISRADLKFLQYSLSDLSFMSSKKVAFFGDRSVQLSEDEFLIYLNHNPSEFVIDKNVVYWNSTSGETKTFFSYDSEKANSIITFSGFLSKQGADAYFSLPFDNKIYVFDKEKQQFDLAYETDNVNDFTRSNREDFQKFLYRGLFQDPANNVSVLGSAFLKNDNYLVFSYYLKGRLYYGLYSMLSNQLRTFSKGFKNDFSFQLVGDPLVITENNELIFVANGETIENYRQQAGFGESFFGNMLKDREIENSLFLFRVKIEPF